MSENKSTAERVPMLRCYGQYYSFSMKHWPMSRSSEGQDYSGRCCPKEQMCVTMNKICEEMNKLRPILKFLVRRCRRRRHPSDTITRLFLRTAELKMKKEIMKAWKKVTYYRIITIKGFLIWKFDWKGSTPKRNKSVLHESINSCISK